MKTSSVNSNPVSQYNSFFTIKNICFLVVLTILLAITAEAIYIVNHWFDFPPYVCYTAVTWLFGALFGLVYFLMKKMSK